MTKRDFIAIAATLDANRASLALVQDFADMCGGQNPNFDRARFIEAATVNMRRDLASQNNTLNYEMGL